MRTCSFARFLIAAVLLIGLLAACCPGGPGAPAMPSAPPASLWAGFTYDGVYRIEVDPPIALLDTPVAIRVTGLQPGQPITLRARMALQTAWESWATFKADATGVVDVTSAAPVYGTYTGVDGMGLFWSMLPVDQSGPGSLARQPLDPLLVTLTAEANDRQLTSVDVKRLLLDDAKAIRQPVEQEGLVGTLFYPKAPGPHPTVIWLGGSEGGLSEGYAALLASRGYAALALAYFGIDPLPPELVEIPLEYFAEAIAWLKTQPAVDPNRIAVMGGSKGAELALLLGAMHPADIKAVVAYKPSAVVGMGLYRNPQSYSQGPKSSWSLDGQGLPFVAGGFTIELLKYMVGQPAALRSSYEEGLKDPAAVAAATIPVERIRGPVLLISGTDDQLWPSAEMGDMVMARLKAHNHPYPYEHLKYEGAGHEISGLYLPMSTSTRAGNLILGGSPAANAHASADSWPKVLAFLEQHLRATDR